MAHDRVAGPFGELDLADQVRLGPARIAGDRGGELPDERGGRAFPFGELAGEVAEHLVGEPGADVPDVGQPVRSWNAHEERADRALPVAFAWSPTTDHNRLDEQVLDLDPLARPPTWLVHR